MTATLATSRATATNTPSTPSTPSTPANRTPSPTRSLVGHGLLATAVAAVATSSVAAVGHASGISLDVSGEPIPVLGFAVLTVVFSLVGVALAAVLARTVRSPRTAFVRTTVVLTALSLVPDALADAGGATIALLMTTHLVAAAIVIPAVTRSLAARRL